MSDDRQKIIYKITTAALWAKARVSGHLPGMPIDETDGYMHFSTSGQVRETLRRHFRGKTGLVLLAVRANDVERDLKWEPSRGGDFFPHLYGELPISAVALATPVDVDETGEAELPEIE